MMMSRRGARRSTCIVPSDVSGFSDEDVRWTMRQQQFFFFFLIIFRRATADSSEQRWCDVSGIIIRVAGLGFI